MTLFIHELKRNLKVLLIWSVCVGLACSCCLLLFEGIQDSMEGMADMYAELGAFSAALGMDRLSVATLKGYYATEIALIFAVGGAMFAAMTGSVMLSKEEEGHTAEFLNTLPLGRSYIVFWKYAAMAVLILAFNIICILGILLGFAGAGEMLPKKEFAVFHGAQLLMHLEVGSVCYLFSAVSKRKQIGAALGFSILLYIMDIMCRILPDIENLKYVTPYYFSNATDIFISGYADRRLVFISILVIVLSAGFSVIVYRKRNLSA